MYIYFQAVYFHCVLFIISYIRRVKIIVPESVLQDLIPELLSSELSMLPAPPGVEHMTCTTMAGGPFLRNGNVPTPCVICQLGTLGDLCLGVGQSPIAQVTVKGK